MPNKKWIFQVSLAIFISNPVSAEERSMVENTGWELWPDSSLTELLHDGVNVESSDALPISGGRYALIIYIKTEGEHGALFRCIDITDKNLNPVEQKCFKLLDKSYIKRAE